MIKLQLGFDLSQDDLYTPEGVLRIDAVFMDYLRDKNVDAYQSLCHFRLDSDAFSTEAYDQLMFSIAPILESFLLHLFSIHDDYRERHAFSAFEDVMVFRTHFLHTSSSECHDVPSEAEYDVLTQWLCMQLHVSQESLSQSQVIRWGLRLLSDSDDASIVRLRRWCSGSQQRYESGSSSFHWYVFWRPRKFGDLRLHASVDPHQSTFSSSACAPIARDDFSLIHSQWNGEQAMIHADYCQYCHDRSVDYCRTGFFKKKGDPSQGYRANKQGQLLHGCPLDQKISQMHWFMRHDQPMSAWIVTMIDNPFCLLTGQRICNDCMQSCIYQKQDPVDTPQVESRIVKDILDLPWGVEIYDLIMRWHPLRAHEFAPREDNGAKVMIMGLGPAGFSVMHHLWMRGYSVMGMDGAHLEPWPFGDIYQPVASFSQLSCSLSERVSLGFGGVCEYGITSRWDKNLLAVIYLSLLRRSRCEMLGNCRFGGGVTVEDAWRMGFDHLVLALGAGLPRALAVPNSLAPGMMQASDFLMSLHTLGAQWSNHQTSLSLQLPCVVIGAGLTAVDTATEAQTYYLHMVQMVYLRMKKLMDCRGESAVRSGFSVDEYARLCIWFKHGQAIFQEKQQASRAKRAPCFRALLELWGGVRLIYRGSIQQAAAYRNNHDELQAALDMGIVFQAETQVHAVTTSSHGFVDRLWCLRPWGIPEPWPDIRLTDFTKQSESWRCLLSGHHALFQSGMILQLASVGTTAHYWRVVAVGSRSIDLEPWSYDTRATPSQSLVVDSIISSPLEDCSMQVGTVLVATGSLPNTAYEYEHRGHFERSGAFYALRKLSMDGMRLSSNISQDADAFFTSYHQNHHMVSVIGDLHPYYHGSVVKALASGKLAAVEIEKHLSAVRDLRFRDKSLCSEAMSLSQISQAFHSKVISVTNLFNDYYLFVVYAPQLVHKIRPGNMFKLRPYIFGPDGVSQFFGCEPVSCQPFDFDVAQHTISFVLRANSKSKKSLCSMASGSRVSIMGPTGVGLSIRKDQGPILFIADTERLMSACLYRKHYCSYASHVDFYVVYSDEALQLLTSVGLQDDVCWLRGKQFPSHLMHALRGYKSIMLHGSFSLIRHYHTYLSQLLRDIESPPSIIGYVGGPMRCMLKGICAQCLQWQIDPDTGQRTKAVFACSWQDQPLSLVDMDHFEQRHHGCRAFSKLNECWSLVDNLT